MALIPETIETERLRLRQWRNEDWGPLASIYGDPETAQYIGGVQAHNFCWLILSSEAGHWQLRGYGMWAIEEKASGQFVGYCGPWHPGFWPAIELSWSLVKAFHGRGYATEAATAARLQIYRDLEIKTLVSYVHPDNAPSHRLAERLGCTNEGETTLPTDSPAICWRHPSPAELAAGTVH